MASARLRPLVSQAREVGDVVGDDDAPLLCGEFQYLVIGQGSEILVLIQGKHVVPGGRKWPPEMTAGGMRIEQDAQRLTLGRDPCHMDEGVELAQLL